MEYSNHIDQSLPVFNLKIIMERSFSFLGLDGTAEKIEKQMGQLQKIIHIKIMYVSKNR